MNRKKVNNITNFNFRMRQRFKVTDEQKCRKMRLFLACIILQPRRRRRLVPPKRRLIFDRLHGVIPQKIELFIPQKGNYQRRTIQTKKKRRCTSATMPRVGLEPTIPVFEGAKTFLFQTNINVCWK
jgi:hypothetical protein